MTANIGRGELLACEVGCVNELVESSRAGPARLDFFLRRLRASSISKNGPKSNWLDLTRKTWLVYTPSVDGQLVNAGIERQEEEEGAFEAEAEGDLDREEHGERNCLHFVDDTHVHWVIHFFGLLSGR